MSCLEMFMDRLILLSWKLQIFNEKCLFVELLAVHLRLWHPPNAFPTLINWIILTLKCKWFFSLVPLKRMWNSSMLRVKFALKGSARFLPPIFRLSSNCWTIIWLFQWKKPKKNNRIETWKFKFKPFWWLWHCVHCGLHQSHSSRSTQDILPMICSLNACNIPNCLLRSSRWWNKPLPV